MAAEEQETGRKSAGPKPLSGFGQFPPDQIEIKQIVINVIVMPPLNPPSPPPPYERLAVIAVVFVVVGLFGYLVINHNPSIDKFAGIIAAFTAIGIVAYMVVNPHLKHSQNVFVLVRIFTSSAAAVFGATIPGFLQITYEGAGWAISAAGALALFLLTFLFTPKILPR